jgi:hypothetical protein
MAKKRRRARSRHLAVHIVAREGWGTALEVGGVTQSVSVPQAPADAPPGSTGADDEPRPGPGGGYWGLLLPPECPCRTLLLGLGGGTVAHLLAQRCPGVAIVGVEHDAEVLAVARSEFRLDELPGLQMVEADAFAWVAAHSTAEAASFDFICLDLFEAGRLALGALATPFLRQVAALLSLEGTLTVNLMITARTPDQVRRLQRVFVVRRELRLRGNLVVHARRPSPGEQLEQEKQEGTHVRRGNGRATLGGRRAG